MHGQDYHKMTLCEHKIDGSVIDDQFSGRNRLVFNSSLKRDHGWRQGWTLHDGEKLGHAWISHDVMTGAWGIHSHKHWCMHACTRPHTTHTHTYRWVTFITPCTGTQTKPMTPHSSFPLTFTRTTSHLSSVCTRVHSRLEEEVLESSG